MKTFRHSRIRYNIVSILLIAALLAQCAPVVFAAQPDAQIRYLAGGDRNEDGTWNPEYWVDSDGNRIEETTGRVNAAESLPSKYDLRTRGVITSVKYQAAARNCWSFAAIASLESSYILQGYGTAANTDFSEAHLVWFTHSQRTTNTKDPTYGDGLQFSNPYANGGNWNRVAATLMRGAGLQLEKNAPWYASDNVNTMKQKMQQQESNRYVSHARMWAVQSIRDKSITAFKKKIMENGAATFSYYHDVQPSISGQGESPGYNPSTYSYYQKTVSNVFNHSVTVVGWDDNFPRSNFKTRPSQNGAWLVKGSWDTTYGNNGYYWISYYDPSICEMASYVAAPKDVYDHIYQYDGAITKMTFAHATSAKMANVFKSQRDELLTHVAFYSPNATPVKATVEIYVMPQGEMSPENHPTYYKQKIDAATTTLNDVEFGYTTVELAKPTLLRKDQTFSVVVTFSLPGGTVQIPVEGETIASPAEGIETYSGSVGDSFISFGDGRWYDTNNYANGYDYNNVPVKAMTRDVTLQEPTLTVLNAPSRTTYRVGDTLDPAGLTLEYTDEVGQSQIVTKGFTYTPTTLSVIGKQTVTVTYNDLSAAFDVTVDPYETKLSLVTPPEKTTYRVGDTLDTAGLSLLYTDVYNQEHTVTAGFTCEPSALTAIGRQTVQVTYAGKSVTFDVTVEPYETSLTVLQNPNKTAYMVGDALDTAGLTLLYTDEYNAWHTVTEGYVCNPQQFGMYGTQTVTVTYGTASTSFDVTVEPYETTLRLVTPPSKTTYHYGETLDTTGLSLVFSDEFGDAFAVTEGFTCDAETFSAFGTHIVTVTYNDLSVTFDVTVIPYEQTLSLVTPPLKTEYLYGETLETEGLSLLYRDEYGQTHTVTDGFVCDVQTLNAAGVQTVTVTYADLSVTFDVSVELREPTLTLLTAPDKTTYPAAESLDTTGLSLAYTDEFGIVSTVTEGFTCTPGTLRALGTQTVTVTYKGLSVTFDVTVEPLEPTLTLQNAPDKTAYLIGEVLETAGLTLVYTDEIGDALVVTEGFACNPTYFSNVGSQSVTVSYMGLSVTFDVTVELREPTLTIVSMPDTTRYFEGDTLDLTGLLLVYSDEYGNVSEITDGFTYETVTFDTLGSQTVTVTYNDVSVSFDVKVVLMDPTLTIMTMPEKTVYPYGEPLDTAGLSLEYTDDFGVRQTVTEGFVCTPTTFSMLGTQSVSVTYLGLSVTFDVTVEPLEPTLTLQTTPKKTTYMVNDTIDTTGLSLVYTDEYGDALVVTEGYSCEPTAFTMFGAQTVTVTYNGLSATFGVMISAYEPTLVLVTPPDKTTYFVGDMLDTTGLTLVYTDEYNRESTVEYGYIYDLHLLNEIGTQTVTVTYSDACVTFDVSVEPYEPTLTIEQMPEKTTFMVRETLDTAGLALVYTDEYNTRHTVTEGFVCSPQTLRTIGTQTVTVTYGAKSAAFDVQVNPYETTLSLTGAPIKTTYLYGETLDMTGLSMLYTDEYGDAIAVTEGFTCDVATMTAFGTQTVTVTYGGRTVTFDVTVDPHEKTLTLVTPAEKRAYLYGETLDTAGLSLQYKNEYGEVFTVTEGFACDTETLDTLGTQTVTVTYEGLSAAFDVTVAPHEPTLTLAAPPEKTTYLATESPDLTGMSLVYTDIYGAASDVTEDYTVTPESLRALGTQTVTVTYEGLSVSFDVTVQPIEPTLTLQIAPAKTEYLTGETPDTTGLTLLYTNEVGDALIVTEGYACAPDMFRTPGVQTVTVTYEGLSVTFDVTVGLRDEVLTLKTLPAKTAYHIGETLDTAGLSISYTDSLGTTQILTSGFTCEPAAFSAVGTQTVTVSYNGLSVTFDVTVTMYTPTLTIRTAPKKTAYFVGETLDTAGLSLTYSDEYGKAATVTAGFVCTPKTLTKVGAQTVTVSYSGLTATFGVTVKAVEPVSLKVLTPPTRGSYNYKSNPDFSGLTVSVQYNDGHEQTVTDLSQMTVRPESNARVRRGPQTYLVTCEGVSATFTMQVNLTFIQWMILIFLLGFIWY
ncbi:MAG: bacterial Ig-like domain-containing protein [Clostridia bacterium]|nr:bacterial Ig-like domain-containing protein [Clostridia bacterium]